MTFSIVNKDAHLDLYTLHGSDFWTLLITKNEELSSHPGI